MLLQPDGNRALETKAATKLDLDMQESDFLLLFEAAQDVPLCLHTKQLRRGGLRAQQSDQRVYTLSLCGDNILNGPLRVLGPEWHAAESAVRQPDGVRRYAYVRSFYYGAPLDLKITFTATDTSYRRADGTEHVLMDCNLRMEFERAWTTRPRQQQAPPVAQ